MAMSNADNEAFRFVGPTSGDDGKSASDHVLTYRQLDSRARALAAWLQMRGAAGERVLLPHCDGPLQIEALLGCLYAGAIAVPCPSPLSGGRFARRLALIARDTDATLALVDSVTAPEVSRVLAGSALVCLAADRAELPSPDDWRRPDPDDDDIGLIQYTSGSVARPNGVLITYRNLLAAQHTLTRALGTSGTSVIGGWLPPYHDMGLVGQLLHPLHVGARGVIMSAGAFARRPLSWLEMIEAHGVTVSGGPDFAYAMCVRGVTDEQVGKLDLSGWQVAVNGAEPIREATLRAFARKFAPAGLRAEALYPAYGLAEATLMVAGGAPGQAPSRRAVDAVALADGRLAEPAPGGRRRTLVGVGRPRGSQVLIVAPDTRQVLEQGRVGEIWIRGESVGAGYWRDRAETIATFGARTRCGEEGFLRSGDLGVQGEDGELFVIGRIKDNVIINGADVAPEEIEASVQEQNPLFRNAAAFTVGPDPDRLVVIQEVHDEGLLDSELPALADVVRRHLEREFGVTDAAVLLVRPGAVRRTTSGKLQRSAMRRALEDGGIRPLYHHSPALECGSSVN
jgi:acyl-CoA synthetase (AMP-forming)/AMP-acid ligase II